MKKTRKLIPALAMLLLSAVMLSTASFAWFSMNTKVEALGMKVQATAGNSLTISNAKTGTFAATANSSKTTQDSLMPTDYDYTGIGANQAKLGWYYLIGANASDEAAVSGTPTDNITDGDSNATASYISTHNFYVKSYGAMKDLAVETGSVSTSATGTETKLLNSVSVKVNYGAQWAIYKQTTGTTWALTASGNTNNSTITADTTSSAVLISGNLKDYTGSTEDAYEIVVEVFFDGTDETCYTDNIDSSVYTVNISFKATEGTAQA